MKAWEIARKPKVVVYPNDPVTYVRARMRSEEEPIAVVVESEKSEKVAGYITWNEVIQVTSHYSHLRAKDVALDHPVAYRDEDIADIYRRMVEERVYALPILESKENPRLVGVVTIADIVRALRRAGFKPVAETVAEVMTVEDLDRYLVEPGERVDRVWSDLVYRRMPGKVVVRSREDPVPWGVVTPREFVSTSRWFFHRESERGLKTVAKVRRIMLRGVPVATPETPIEYVADVMAEHEYTVLPVIDEKEGRVLGVVTIFDVARAYIEGAKPGRAKPVAKPVVPIEVKPEERIAYVSTEKVLQQVMVERPQPVEIAGVTAADIARSELPAITVNDSIEHARRVMLRYRSNYVLVVDEDGNIKGVVSKWSMLKAIGLRGPLWRRRVYDKFFIDFVMDTNVERVKPDASIEEVALKMVSSRSEVAIVEDEDGRPIGFITKDDLVEAYRRLMIGRSKVENIMTPGRIGIVHPHHSLYHAVNKMHNFYLDALAVYDGREVIGVVSANRLPFVAYEDAMGRKSRRLIWVRKLVRGSARRGRYVKVLPLIVLDVTTELRGVYVRPDDDAVKAIEIMEKYNVDGVPVVDRDGRVLGVVTKTDVVRELARTARVRIERGLPTRVEKGGEEAEAAEAG
ncbi:CBS domain-containing protein [Aeropyrum camini]|uniref:CBS domain-containing protein n=1 Tax=Aeropyrum camini SY1 = JCM 12091 TaxID=1198449 RepID=U3TDC0_9CREN|nr:CBS domain-containing protein [Aeropyrum camini]BAN90020.1 hypothetical protein ACAM_0551 [Aeropyrum camini SY1 = JCM 12091]